MNLNLPKTKLTKDGKSVVRNDSNLAVYDRSGNKVSSVDYPTIRAAKYHMNQIK